MSWIGPNWITLGKGPTGDQVGLLGGLPEPGFVVRPLHTSLFINK